jgi:twitching motility protein PilT
MLELDQLLRHAVDEGASDIHVKVGSRPRLRVDGALRETPFETVEPGDTERVAAAIVPPSRAPAFAAMNEADFTYGIGGVGRFRVSMFRQRGWVGLVLRRVMPGIPGFDSLRLPATVAKLAEQPHGLVLVAGLSGSGKTATLAAMVDHVNGTRESHIVTIEDPIEVLHADKRSIVNQREVGTDTPSYETALAHALRQDPDVIMVGELRDAGAVGAALQAAAMGRLVFAGTPTSSVVDTVEHMVEVFEPHRRLPARAILASTLRGVVVQCLLPRTLGRGRVPAVEILVSNARVVERLADPDRTDELEQEMVQGDLYGMQSFDQSLVQLYSMGLVSQSDAIAHARRPAEVRFELDRADFERAQTPSPQWEAAGPDPRLSRGPFRTAAESSAAPSRS